MNPEGTHYYLNMGTTVLIAVVGTVLIGLIACEVFIFKRNPVEAQLLRAGDRLTGLQEINFSKSRHTILFALSTNCSSSDLSVSVQKEIMSKVSPLQDGRLIAIFDENEVQVKDYLRKHKLDIEFLSDADLAVVGIDLTPTVVLVDGNRMIRASYEGLLQDEQERDLFEVLGRIFSG